MRMRAATDIRHAIHSRRKTADQYNVDFKRWDRDYHKDMDAWIKILRESR